MGSLFTSLFNASNSLGVYTRVLNVVSNNVTNANTPGYAKQSAVLEALPFDLSVGLPGGVAFGGVQSARDAYAERGVQEQQGALGYYQQKASDLSQLSGLFDVTGKSGIGPAVDNLIQSFSQLSVSPNDVTARQNVLNQASRVAEAFQNTAAGLQSGSSQIKAEAQTSIATINKLAGVIAHINGTHAQDGQGSHDAGADAQLNSSLEELSKYANFTALQQPDGSVTVYLGGQTPLVMGSQANAIQGDFSRSQFRVLDSQGHDISSQITQGQLAGQLEVHNTQIPSYVSDLNTLAQGLADQVNGVFGQGIDGSGAAPASALFTYTAGAPSQSIAVNPSLTSGQIPAALPGAPGGNGNALALAALGQAQTLNGYTFTGFYGTLGARVGQDINDAQSAGDTQSQVLLQAQNLRSQTSGVSLDAEAENLITFQRGYQAAAKMVGVLNQLTQTAVDLIP